PEHRDRRAQRMDLRGRGVAPDDADLRYAEPVPPGEPDQLDVVREAVDRQLAPERAPRLAREQLEAALRVREAAHPEQADDPVERLAHQLAVERLALDDVRPRHRAAADHDLRLGQPRFELLDLLDR